MINSNLYAEEQIPDFPYDPEERATEMKMCAKVCLRRRDVCVKREKNNQKTTFRALGYSRRGFFLRKEEGYMGIFHPKSSKKLFRLGSEAGTPGS